MNPALQNILSRLQKVKKVGNGWQACCPAHADRDPSCVSMREKTGAFCLSVSLAVIPRHSSSAWLRMTDLSPRPQPQAIETKNILQL